MKYFNQTLGIEYYDIEEAQELIKNMSVTWFGKHYKFADISASFDIETSNFYDEKQKVALMYIWQFGITDDVSRETYVIVGRTWEEFIELLRIIEEHFKQKQKRLKAEYLFPIYVHNLSFEFTFLRPYLMDKITSVFGVKAQSVLFFRTSFFEFRCSMLLSGMPLAKLPTNKWHKAVGDLDYKLLRHNNTPLTDKEMSYCLLDVLVLCEYISIKRKQDGNINKIPYTKTGYPRRGLREWCMGDYKDPKRKKYISNISGLKYHSYKEYIIHNYAYMGGHTACNPWYNDKVVKNVTCYDFTSSYPAVMVSSPRFPRKFYAYDEYMSRERYEKYIEQGFALVSMATFKNIKNKVEYDSWISTSKILDFKENNTSKINNGKLFEHEGEITVFITEVDYEIYKYFYEWDDVSFECVYSYVTDYLPKPVIEYVLKLYRDKTELKGVVGEELDYQLAKEQLNSLYGMCVTDICRDLLECSRDGDWITTPQDEEGVKGSIEQYNKNMSYGKVATPYIWGVYVSALARYNLASGIKYSGDLGLWLYADTDSIYVKDAEKIKPYINNYNSIVEQEMNKMCEYYNMDKDCWRPKNQKGEEKPLGFWDFDGHYKMFKTLGAKRYIKLDDNGVFKITVAGLGKNEGGSYMMEHWNNDVLAVFKNFKDGLTIPSEYTGKLTHTIITTPHIGKLTDYLGETIEYMALGGTHLEPCSFNLSMSDEYINFLRYINTVDIKTMGF